ncbi:MAG: SUMF1/EgtB/PvdO family nonheme iron enzyme, partial [Bernardetiaceae bacterium]|nr:SUMF1/EgtB/PvdO family nonheme iron enzyme [Bernardetiaceae bacterium]
MNKLTKAQAEEIFSLIQDTKIAKAFDKIKECGIAGHKLKRLEDEFVHGGYPSDFYERLQVFVNTQSRAKLKVSPPKHYDIFFSFSSKDEQEAIKYVQVLRKCGLQVFFSNTELKESAGEDFSKRIEHALEHCDHFILHCTPNSVESSWVEDEWKLFYNNRHLTNKSEHAFFILEGKDYDAKILPFRLKNVQTSNLKGILDKLNLRLPEEEQIKKLEVANEILKQENERNTERLEAYRAKVVLVEDKLDKSERQKNKLQIEVKDLHEQLQKMREALAKNATSGSALEALNFKIDNLQKQLQAKEVALKATTEQKNNQVREITDLETELKSWQSKHKQKVQEFMKLQQVLESELDKNKVLNQELQTQKSNLKTIIEQKNNQARVITDLEIELKSWQNKNNQNVHELMKLQQVLEYEINDFQKQLQTKEVALKATTEQKNNQAREITDLETELKAWQSKNNQNVRELMKLQQVLEGELDKNKVLNQELQTQKTKVIALQEQLTQYKVKKEAIHTNAKAKVATQKDFIETIAGVSFKMIYVEGGTFTMGCTPEQGSDCYDSEKPAHKVTLSDYYIAETEVTQKLWRAVMGSGPAELNNKGCDDCPVERVSWNDCKEFIEKLNTLTGKTFRLPTEAEWEFAARGGNKSKGYKYAGSNDVDKVAWYYGNHKQSKHGSQGTTHPVKTKEANEL